MRRSSITKKIASYFADGRFLHETFAERCSIYSLKELLEQIVGRARELSSERSPRLLNPPTTRKEFA
jgi:hypothetical protein